MYKYQKAKKTSIKINNSYEGETIETKIKRITTNNEPIQDGAPLIYTERKEGVKPEFNIRTDRFELAVEAMDVATKNHIAKRTGGPTGDQRTTEGPTGESSGAANIQATE